MTSRSGVLPLIRTPKTNTIINGKLILRLFRKGALDLLVLEEAGNDGHQMGFARALVADDEQTAIILGPDVLKLLAVRKPFAALNGGDFIHDGAGAMKQLWSLTWREAQMLTFADTP